MIESIYVGMTGLLGYSKGLRVIANNTANMNTPGFKGSSIEFSDMFYSNTGHLSGSQLGYGLNTVGTTMNFQQGELRQTGNDLDMAVDGQGLFVLQNEAGDITYTRAGQFEFNQEGILVNRGSGETVWGFDASGNGAPITLIGNKSHPGKATSQIEFSGNLSSSATEQVVSGIKVFDAVGGAHTLSATLTNNQATESGSWTVELFDGTTSIGKGTIQFLDGKPVAAGSKISLTYTPQGQSPIPLALNFGGDVTSYASGDFSTLMMKSQDGVVPGSMSKATFDSAGYLVITYTNGQTTKGNRLALARFESLGAVESVGDNQFAANDSTAWLLGTGGDPSFGEIRSGMIEISNIDLSKEFSDLVIMQRGYQASSQIISTANEMIQELFSIKSR